LRLPNLLPNKASPGSPTLNACDNACILARSAVVGTRVFVVVFVTLLPEIKSSITGSIGGFVTVVSSVFFVVSVSSIIFGGFKLRM
jgi:hypothetical protein